MSNRRFNRVMVILINAIAICTCLTNVAYAATDGMGTVTEILTDILGALLGVAGAVCVAKLIHIGILYMTSSAAEKSNAKTAVLPWIIGTIVCFGAGWIGPAIIGILRVDGNVLDY